MRRFWFHKEDEVKPAGFAKLIGAEPEDKTFERAPAGRRAADARVRRALPRSVVWGAAGLAALFVAGFAAASFYTAKREADAAINKDTGALRAGIADLENLDASGAAKEFSSLQDVSPSDAGALFGAFGSIFGNAREEAVSFGNLAAQLALFSGEVGDAASSSQGFFLGGNGAPFVASLVRLRATIDAIQSADTELAAALPPDAAARIVGTNAYLAMKSELAGAGSFLGDLIPWLSSPRPRHLLIMFQNPSELRPAGGFLGSYADLVIASGSVERADIHDIAGVDASFAPKIVPPEPLQIAVSRFRPADANWFFDFPTSASETIKFFDESGLYANSSTSFDGAIAVSPKVVSDILSVTGPVAAGHPTTTFTAENFLAKTQEYVQEGQASSATYPKQVLRDLAQAIFTKLSALDDAGKQELFAMLLDWVAKKDVMAYFTDPGLESFAELYGAGGDVYALPHRFNGDYLAVVDANAGGGKSDTYVSSTVSYTAEIGAGGTLTAEVAVSRADHAGQGTYWWNRVPNRDYLQVFVAPGAVLQNAEGGEAVRITPPLNYARAGYSTDPLVAAIESSTQTLFAYPGVAWHAEDGKQVFSTWSFLRPGGSSKFLLYYTRKLFTLPAAGVQYQFVFEKQAGTARSYSYEIDAPLGYVFAENGLASYTYRSDDPPGRLIVSLTLRKI